MPPRLQEIFELLQKGTVNGTLKWAAFKTGTAYSTTLKNATFVIALDCHGDGEPYFWNFRVLSTSGDELDSWGADNEGDDSSVFSELWNGIRAQQERTLAARLRPITEVLRASVLGTTNGA